jgi:hypothetical protein
MVVRSCADEHSLELRLKVLEAVDPGGRRWSQDLRSLDAHPGEVSEAKEGGAQLATGRSTGRTLSICATPEVRRALWQ